MGISRNDNGFCIYAYRAWYALESVENRSSDVTRYGHRPTHKQLPRKHIFKGCSVTTYSLPTVCPLSAPNSWTEAHKLEDGSLREILHNAAKQLKIVQRTQEHTISSTTVQLSKMLSGNYIIYTYWHTVRYVNRKEQLKTIKHCAHRLAADSVSFTSCWRSIHKRDCEEVKSRTTYSTGSAAISYIDQEEQIDCEMQEKEWKTRKIVAQLPAKMDGISEVWNIRQHRTEPQAVAKDIFWQDTQMHHQHWLNAII